MINSSNNLNGHLTEERIADFWTQWEKGAPARQQETSEQVRKLMQLRAKKGVRFGRTGQTSPNAGR